MGRVDKRAHKKTRKRAKDVDQIYDEIQPEKIEKSMAKATEPDEDLPALGQFYCIACHRYFKSEEVLKEHNTQKTHKRRVKTLKEKPWSQEESLLMKIDMGKKKTENMEETKM